MRQIVKCSLAALKTAPINPPRQPIQAKIGSSQILKFDASPLAYHKKRILTAKKIQIHHCMSEMEIPKIKRNFFLKTQYVSPNIARSQTRK